MPGEKAAFARHFCGVTLVRLSYQMSSMTKRVGQVLIRVTLVRLSYPGLVLQRHRIGMS